MRQRSNPKNERTSSKTKSKKTRWRSFLKLLKKNQEAILILVSIILTVINNFPQKKPNIQIINIYLPSSISVEPNLDYPPLAPCHQVQHVPSANQPPPQCMGKSRSFSFSLPYLRSSEKQMARSPSSELGDDD